jgi:hypothetical protein
MSLEDRAKAAAREAEAARLEESRRSEEEGLSRIEAATRSRVMEWFERVGVQPVPIHYDGLKDVWRIDKEGDRVCDTYARAHWQLEGHDYSFACQDVLLNNRRLGSVLVRKLAPVHPDRECTACPHEPDWAAANDLTQLGAALQSDQPRVLPQNYGEPRVKRDNVVPRRRWWGN